MRPDAPSPVKCQICYLMLKSEDDLRVHHCLGAGRKEQKCPECGLMVIGLENFKQHILAHSHKETAVKRARVETSADLGEVPQCAGCATVFLEDSDLKLHEGHCAWQKAMAAGSCVCADCGKGFAEQWYLKLHIRRHYIERPFLCPYCPLDFHTRKNITKHIRLCHLQDLLSPPNGSMSIIIEKVREHHKAPEDSDSGAETLSQTPDNSEESASRSAKSPKVVLGSLVARDDATKASARLLSSSCTGWCTPK